jgi:hypothetical protein
MHSGAAGTRLGSVPRSSYRPDPGTSHRNRLEENAATVSLKISADAEDALFQVSHRARIVMRCCRGGRLPHALLYCELEVAAKCRIRDTAREDMRCVRD